MAKIIAKNSIKIGKEPVVILPLREYEKLRQRAVPTYYLKGKKAKELDRLVEEELRDYEMGQTIRASSLKEALKIYGREKNRKN